MSGMAEVNILVEHVLLTSRNGFAACAAEGCTWEDSFHRPDRYEQAPLFVRVAHADHQMELLAAAGFGPVKEAAATALEDAADENAVRSDTLLKTMQNMADSREYELVNIVRYGAFSAEAKVMESRLRARAAAVRGEG